MMYELRLTKDQVLLIGEALAAMPFGRVVHIVAELQKQVTVQDQIMREQQTGEATAKGPE